MGPFKGDMWMQGFYKHIQGIGFRNYRFRVDTKHPS